MENGVAEHGPDAEIKCPPGWGTRHTLAVLGFWSFIFNYAMRFNLALAIVAMVPSGHHIKGVAGSWNRSFLITEGACGAIIIPTHANHSAHANLAEIEPVFNWSEAEQGFILGAFFWGYVLSGLPGGILSLRYGAKWIIGTGLMVTAGLTLLIPLAAGMGKEVLILVRVLQGIAEGVTVPAMQSMLSKWLPPDERGKLSTIVYSGIPAGTALTMVVSGYLIELFGWPMVFYGIGGVSFLWVILWAFLVSSTPATHPRISFDEKEYIINSIGEQNSKNETSVPWKSIITSVPVLSIFIAHIAQAWGMYTLLSELPTYMKTALNFDMKQNKWASASPHLCKWVLATVITQIGDRLIHRKMFSITVTRKLCNTTAQWGAAACLVVVAYSGCNPIVTLLFLNLSVGLLGGAFGGFLVNTIDIAPNFAGLIMGLDHAISNMSGFFAPYAAGALISGDPSLEHWRTVFLITAAVFFVGNLIYITFGSSKEATWNRQAPAVTETSKLSRSDDALNLRPRNHNYN